MLGPALKPLQLLNGDRIKVTSVSHPHSSAFASLHVNQIVHTLPEFLTGTAEEVLQLLLLRTQTLPKRKTTFDIKM